MFKYSVRIREVQIDSLGHMNNAAYLSLYEEARWELITSRGFGVNEIKERQQAPVILDVTVRFKSEIRLRETITITCNLLSYSGKIGKLEQKMIKADGTVASEALFTMGFMDLKTRKLIEPTPEWSYAVQTDIAQTGSANTKTSGNT